MRQRPIIFVFLTALHLLAVPVSAHAVSYLSLLVTPVRAELSANPGQRVTTEATLTSSSAATQVIGYSASDFVAANETGRPQLVPANKSPWSMSSWVTVQPPAFELAPSASQRVTITVDVPKNAEPGGHYAAALLGTLPGTAKGTRVTGKVGVLVLLTVSGDLEESGTVGLSCRWLYEHGPVPFELRFTNTGNVHVRPTGFVHVTQLWGAPVADVPVDAENTLPDSTRATTTSWTSPGYGVYWTQARVTFGTAGNHEARSQRRLVAVLPWRLVLGGIALFLAGLALPIFWRRLRERMRGERTEA
jgi:hypothetical protein